MCKKCELYCVERSAIFEDGKRIWKKYRTLYVGGEDYEDIGIALMPYKKWMAGGAVSILMKQRDLVDFAASIAFF